MQRSRVIWMPLLGCLCLLYAGAVGAAELRGDFLLGFSRGPSGEAAVRISEIAPSLPFEARIGLGYASQSPGKADEARQIFINNATNGTPEKKGRAWTYRFDLIYPLGSMNENGPHLFAGPRYALYSANFRYVGGNEDFDVRSRQWGFGAGFGAPFAMGHRTDLIFQGGVDYYLESTLHGHDTSYSPDRENVNAREDFTYSDADEAIDQPGVVARLLVGISRRFGP